MKVAPYIFFDGRCAEALDYYGTVFGGTTSQRMRVGDSPVAAQCPPEMHDRIMHATFEADGVDFMASDGMDSFATGQSQRVVISVALDDVDRGERIFTALADGGEIRQPYAKQFWGATFGLLVDKFGIAWMINAG